MLRIAVLIPFDLITKFESAGMRININRLDCCRGAFCHQACSCLGSQHIGGLPKTDKLILLQFVTSVEEA